MLVIVGTESSDGTAIDIGDSRVRHRGAVQIDVARIGKTARRVGKGAASHLALYVVGMIRKSIVLDLQLNITGIGISVDRSRHSLACCG